MRVSRLVVLGPGHPFRGGIAKTTTELVRSLIRRGHNVTFLTPLRQYPRRLYPGGDDRDPEACPEVEGARALLDPFAPPSWPGVRAQIRALAGDAWIFPYWTWAWAPWWRFLLAGGSSRRCPAVAVVHNPIDHDAGVLQRLAARLVLRRCEGLFTHAASLAEGLRNAYRDGSVGSFPLPPPAPFTLPGRLAARRSLGLPEGGLVALFLGLIRPYKGVDVLLDAAARLGESSPWRFLVAGEPWGALGGELEHRVEELDLSERVRLDLGWVPEDRVPTYLAAADLVVLPYRAGSQSAVASMALAHGMPVLSTRVGGLPELVKDGVNGVLVPPGNPEALAAALVGLDDSRLAALAAGARAAAGKLTWDGYAAALEDLLARISHRLSS